MIFPGQRAFGDVAVNLVGAHLEHAQASRASSFQERHHADDVGAGECLRIE